MTETTITPSALAYLFGDLLQDQYASTSPIALNETLPCRGTKAKKNDLAVLILTTACVYWAKQECVHLSLGTKGLLVKSRYVLVARTTKPAARLNGHEGLFLAAISGKERDDGVASIVHRLLRQDSIDPWGRVIKETQRYLVGLGYFAEVDRKGIGKILGKELIPQCDAILSLQPQVGLVRDLLAAFRSAQGELYGQIWKDIGSGITSRQETPDNDLA
jgi:hypothetical protein